ncbi:hypothetical protein B7486_36010 [cyanobacterium TDX16]|nr:hypothetical protein B7486_36010 [cyanobacterium TDX16]
MDDGSSNRDAIAFFIFWRSTVLVLSKCRSRDVLKSPSAYLNSDPLSSLDYKTCKGWFTKYFLFQIESWANPHLQFNLYSSGKYIMFGKTKFRAIAFCILINMS